MTLSPYVYQRVSNPIAQDVLAGLEAFLETGRQRGIPQGMVPVNGEVLNHEELLERLEDSGLAQALAAGPGVLPDPAERGEWLSRRLYSLLRPRNHRQLARQVAFNLDWYLAPQAYPPFPFDLITVPLAICILAYCVADSINQRVPGGVPDLVIVLLVVTIAVLGFLSIRAFLKHGARRQARLFFAQALFDYLLETYTDAPEDEGETGAEDKYGLSWG